MISTHIMQKPTMTDVIINGALLKALVLFDSLTLRSMISFMDVSVITVGDRVEFDSDASTIGYTDSGAVRVAVSIGSNVGDNDGGCDGIDDGEIVGCIVGNCVGNMLGGLDGISVGIVDGSFVGDELGYLVGFTVGISDGANDETVG